MTPIPHAPFATECQICKDIWNLFADENEVTRQLSLGQLDLALASPCQQHSLLLGSLLEIIPGSETKGSLSHASVLFERKCRTPFVSFKLRNLDDPNHDGHHLPLLLEKRQEVHDHPGLARNVDPQWIDVDTIRDWIQTCVTTHGDSCTNPLKISPAIPELLIDVQQRCIVSASSQARFIALSYRFGDSASFCLTEKQLRDLRQDSAIDRPDVLDKLPLTVKHAMFLTAALGERYLWADALCIVHGRSVGTAEQLGQMSAIYATALLTIVADDGDGLTGLRGLRGISTEPRYIAQEHINFCGERLVLYDRAAHHITSKGAYHQRCWTFQEFTMSPRKLIFKHGGVHWVCQRYQWHEDVDFEKEPEFDSHLKAMLSGVPDLQALGLSLSRYNQRNLTFDQDALPAISGFLTVLSRTFAGGLLFGLPEVTFDSALGWKPAFNRKGLVKRASAGTDSFGDLGVPDLPSWSWTAWKGPFAFPSEKVHPITEWYTSDGPRGHERRRIDSTWHRERYTITSPAPITASTPFAMPQQTPYLFANTQKASLWACRSSSTATKSTARDPVLKLRSSSARGAEIGELHLQTDEQLRSWPTTRSRGRTDDQGKCVELVAINRLVVPGAGSGLQETRITVLWVQWEDGIAYRQACGFVLEDAWRLLSLVNVELTLG
jgi:hypothetical protein